MEVAERREPLQFNITVESRIMKQVTSYKYLGSWMGVDGRCDIETRARIGKLRSLLPSLNLDIQLKTRLLKCYVG